MVSYTVATDIIDTIQVATRDADIKVAKQIQHKSRILTPVTVVSLGRGLLRFKPSTALVQIQFLPENGIMDVTLNIPFCILPTAVSSKHIHVPKHVTM